MKLSIKLLLFLLASLASVALKAGGNEPVGKQRSAPSHKKVYDDSLEYIGTFQYGISAIAGRVIGTSYQVPSGENHFKNGGDLGLYFIYPFSKRIYLYLWVGGAEKGYHLNYTRQYSNSTYYRTDVANGFRNLLYLEKMKCLGINLFWNFSIYFGAATSIKVRERFSYDITSYFVPKDPTTHTAHQDLYHYDQTGNTALDFIDMSVVGGVRWNAFNLFNLSFRYMRDVVGLNTSTADVLKNTLVNSGYYVTLEIPLYKNRLFKTYE